jgi:hypothetical protein
MGISEPLHLHERRVNVISWWTFRGCPCAGRYESGWLTVGGARGSTSKP